MRTLHPTPAIYNSQYWLLTTYPSHVQLQNHANIPSNIPNSQSFPGNDKCRLANLAPFTILTYMWLENHVTITGLASLERQVNMTRNHNPTSYSICVGTGRVGSCRFDIVRVCVTPVLTLSSQITPRCRPRALGRVQLGVPLRTPEVVNEITHVIKTATRTTQFVCLQRWPSSVNQHIWQVSAAF